MDIIEIEARVDLHVKLCGEAEDCLGCCFKFCRSILAWFQCGKMQLHPFWTRYSAYFCPSIWCTFNLRLFLNNRLSKKLYLFYFILFYWICELALLHLLSYTMVKYSDVGFVCFEKRINKPQGWAKHSVKRTRLYMKLHLKVWKDFGGRQHLRRPWPHLPETFWKDVEFLGA